MKTENVSLHLHEETELVLNCTYHKESKEDIGKRGIKWQKRIGDIFKDVAVFSPPGGQHPFIEREMKSIYSNRTELIAPANGSFSAVLILKDLVCDDAGKYQCCVDFFFNDGTYEATILSTVAFKGRIMCS